MEKVLIITYYWPPAGGPGVQRWLKFVKYLGEFGYKPVVFVPENAHYPLQDASLEKEVPLDVEIIKTPILEPYTLAKLFSKGSTEQISTGIIPEEGKQGILQQLMLFVRGNLFIPDARKFWVRPSVRFLADYIQKNGIERIITTGPPHSVHLIGLGLKERLNLQWIADFRDPWTSIGYHDKLKLTGRSKRKHKELEKKVLEKADRLITTSFATRKEFQGITASPISVITNGYDVENVPEWSLDQKFSISHIGSLLSGRNPENLWKALAELLKEVPSFQNDFELHLTGAVGEKVLDSVDRAGLRKYLKLKGYVSHQEALKLQRSAQVLMLIEIDSEETRGIIPGKLFEYMVSNRPILAVGPNDSDPQKIIKETNTGRFFGYMEKEAMKEYILSCYRSYQKNELRTHPIGLQKYSRKALTGELVKLFG